MNIQTLTGVVATLHADLVAYEEKPRKATSKRIRLALGEIKNFTPQLRADLVAADKAGY